MSTNNSRGSFLSALISSIDARFEGDLHLFKGSYFISFKNWPEEMNDDLGTVCTKMLNSIVIFLLVIFMEKCFMFNITLEKKINLIKTFFLFTFLRFLIISNMFVLIS
jgi:hypothetical protein